MGLHNGFSYQRGRNEYHHRGPGPMNKQKSKDKVPQPIIGEIFEQMDKYAETGKLMFIEQIVNNMKMLKKVPARNKAIFLLQPIQKYMNELQYANPQQLEKIRLRLLVDAGKLDYIGKKQERGNPQEIFKQVAEQLKKAVNDAADPTRLKRRMEALSVFGIYLQSIAKK